MIMLIGFMARSYSNSKSIAHPRSSETRLAFFGQPVCSGSDSDGREEPVIGCRARLAICVRWGLCPLSSAKANALTLRLENDRMRVGFLKKIE